MSFLNIKKREKKKNRLVFPVGSYSWTVPDGTTEVEVHVWGGGGNGRPWSTSTPGAVGTGGGGGGYARHLYKVSGGNVLQITVGGQGGTSSVSCPSNATPQPISATGGSDGSQSSGVAPGTGGAGGTGSIAGVPVPLRIAGITMAANGGAGGGIGNTTTDYAPTTPLPFPGTNFPAYLRTSQPQASPFGPQMKGDFLGASGGAAGSHLGNGGNGSPSVGYPFSIPGGGGANVLNNSFEGIALDSYPTVTWGPYGCYWSVGGAGIGGQDGPSPVSLTSKVPSYGSLYYSDPSTPNVSHLFKGASAEYPDICPFAITGARNKSKYGASKYQDISTGAIIPYYGYPSYAASNENYSYVHEKWFYVEEMVGSNGVETYGPTISPPTRGQENSLRAGCGQNGYIERNFNPNNVISAPFLGGGAGGKYFNAYMNAFPSISPGIFGVINYPGRGGYGSIGGGGGGQALGQPGDNGIGGVGCVIIYW